jgi:hypothetical protein
MKSKVPCVSFVAIFIKKRIRVEGCNLAPRKIAKEGRGRNGTDNENRETVSLADREWEKMAPGSAARIHNIDRGREMERETSDGVGDWRQLIGRIVEMV